MKRLSFIILLVGMTANAQFNQTRDEYAKSVGNYKPSSQVSLLVGKNTWEVGYSYTDILTWGLSFERTQFDNVNNQKPFYALYGSIGAEFSDVTITIKAGGTKLQQMNSDKQTTHFSYGGSFEYRVIPNLGVVVGSDATCDCLLVGVNVHFGEK